MDLREIQRLHFQFAPDSMTIDLPRHIAALPAPADVTALDKQPAIKVRLPKAAPIVRRSLIAVAIAAVVGMAGMGGASLYKSVSQAPAHKSNVTAAPAQSDSGVREGTEETPHAVATRSIDATPPHPVPLAPMLTGKDIAPIAPIGLTADQFKNSLGGTGGPAASVATAKLTASLPDDEQRAAASPIHQTRGEPETVRQAPAKPTTAAVVAASAPAAATAAPNRTVPVQPPTADGRPSASSGAPARTHSYRHHSRSREEHSGDSEEVSAATKKPASASRAGANEVQMF